MEVVADGTSLQIVVLLRSLVVPVREDHVEGACLTRRVEVARHIVRCEGELWALVEGYGEHVVVFRVDGEVGGDAVVELAKIHVAVAVIDEHHVGELRHLLQYVRVVHEVALAPGEGDCLAHFLNGLEEEALARPSVALVVLANLVVHGLRCPGTRYTLVAVEHIAHDEYLVDEVLLLLTYLIGSKPIALYVERMFFEVCLRALRIVLEVVFRLLAPEETAGID